MTVWLSPGFLSEASAFCVHLTSIFAKKKMAAEIRVMGYRYQEVRAADMIAGPQGEGPLLYPLGILLCCNGSPTDLQDAPWLT